MAQGTLQQAAARAGQALGFAPQSGGARTPAALSVVALTGVALGFGAIIWITYLLRQGAVYGPTTFAFDDAPVANGSFWQSDAVLARENLSVYFSLTVVGAVIALIGVAAIMWRAYRLRLALLIIVASTIGGIVLGPIVTNMGVILDFFVDDLMVDAVRQNLLPANAVTALHCQIDLAARFGFAAGYATMGAGILFAMPGEKGSRYDVQLLRQRWHMMLAIYVLAMVTVAMMALGPRLIVDYAAALLEPAHAPVVAVPEAPEGAAIAIDHQAAAQKLGAAMSLYAAVATTLILILACAPSFVSIRRDVEHAAAAQAAASALAKEEQAQERAKYAADPAKAPMPGVALDIEVTSPADWITNNRLGMNWLKSVIALLATLAPVLLPVLAGVAEKIAGLTD
jgi:hypothetical protein